VCVCIYVCVCVCVCAARMNRGSHIDLHSSLLHCAAQGCLLALVCIRKHMILDKAYTARHSNLVRMPVDCLRLQAKPAALLIPIRISFFIFLEEEFYGTQYQSGSFLLLMWGVDPTACVVFLFIFCPTSFASHARATVP
jgi:hypothetical protein